MKHPYEVEVKLKVCEPRALKRRLRDLGCGVAERRHFEANVVFDFDDQRLLDARSLLRLRTVGRRHIVTFKGAPEPSASYKVRREIETEVEDGAVLQNILESLGLKPVFRYEKYRTAYAETNRDKKHSHGAILLDETPIGNFLELEGSRRWINHWARQLGYRQQNYITASYGTLYRQDCKQRGIVPGNMVF